MKRNLFVLMMFIAASLLMACGDMGAGNAASSKPANSSASNANVAAAPVNPAAVEGEIKKLMDAISAGLNKNDADAMDKLYADNYMIVQNDGSVQNKAERLAALRSGDTKYTSFQYIDPIIRVNADGNSAVSLTKLTVKGTSKGRPMDGDYRVTGVYNKTKDGWKLMSASSTKITAADAKMDDKAKADDKSNTNQAQRRTGNVKLDAQIAD